MAYIIRILLPRARFAFPPTSARTHQILPATTTTHSTSTSTSRIQILTSPYHLYLFQIRPINSSPCLPKPLHPRPRPPPPTMPATKVSFPPSHRNVAFPSRTLHLGRAALVQLRMALDSFEMHLLTRHVRHDHRCHHQLEGCTFPSHISVKSY